MVQKIEADGITLYRHNAWASSPDGAGMTLTEMDGEEYVGHAISRSSADITNPDNYTWVSTRYTAAEPEEIAANVEEIIEISDIETLHNAIDDGTTDDYVYDNATIGTGASVGDESFQESGAIEVSLISGKIHPGYANQYIRSGNVVHIDVVIDATEDVPPGKNIATGQLLFLPAPALNARCVCYYGDNPVITLLRPDGSFTVRNCGRDNLHAGNDIAINTVYITDGTMLMGEAIIEPAMMADLADADDDVVIDVNNTPSGIDYDNIRQLQAGVME